MFKEDFEEVVDSVASSFLKKYGIKPTDEMLSRIREALLESIKDEAKHVAEDTENPKTYQVRITETLERIVDVDAKDEQEALQKVRDDYAEEKIILTGDDNEGGAEIDIVTE